MKRQYVIILIALMMIVGMSSKIEAQKSCPIYTTKYKLSMKSAYGVTHALSSYHKVANSFKYYQIIPNGFDPFTATNRKKTYKNTGTSGYYRMDYKWKDWTGYPHTVKQEQSGKYPKGFTTYTFNLK
ncbi:MAG: hypothetical protein LBT75_01460 [Bacilli bacterium]|jgi:hypothetical protein|nr:hypothetical protein [Bacilli bacterium]